MIDSHWKTHQTLSNQSNQPPFLLLFVACEQLWRACTVFKSPAWSGLLGSCIFPEWLKTKPAFGDHRAWLNHQSTIMSYLPACLPTNHGCSTALPRLALPAPLAGRCLQKRKADGGIGCKDRGNLGSCCFMVVDDGQWRCMFINIA